MATSRSAFGPKDTALLVLLALTWGNSFLFIKLAVAVLPPPWIVTARMTLGGLLLLGVGALLRKPWPRSGRDLAMLAFVGVTGCSAPWVTQAWAQRQLDSGLVAVLNACTPVATMLMALAAGQERVHRNRVVGLSVAITGTLIVVGGEVSTGKSKLALLAAVMATLGYAFAAVVTRAHVSGRIAPLPAAAAQLCLGALALGPVAWITTGPPTTDLSPTVIAALLALGVLGTGMAFLIYFTLLERVGATNTSMVTYLAPVVGLTSGALFRGERFGMNVLLGAVALICGVWLAQRTPA